MDLDFNELPAARGYQLDGGVGYGINSWGVVRMLGRREKTSFKAIRWERGIRAGHAKMWAIERGCQSYSGCR